MAVAVAIIFAQSRWSILLTVMIDMLYIDTQSATSTNTPIQIHVTFDSIQRHSLREIHAIKTFIAQKYSNKLRKIAFKTQNTGDSYKKSKKQTR